MIAEALLTITVKTLLDQNNIDVNPKGFYEEPRCDF